MTHTATALVMQSGRLQQNAAGRLTASACELLLCLLYSAVQIRVSFIGQEWKYYSVLNTSGTE